MIPFYDRLKPINYEPVEIKIPSKMVIASDREKVYFSGVVSVKIKDPEKAYTTVENFQASVLKSILDLTEEKIKKNKYLDIKKNKKEFDEEITKKLRYNAEIWGLEVKRVKLNVDH